MVLSRRSFFTGFVGLVAAPSSAASAAPVSVSARMLLLINEFNRRTATLKAIDYHDAPGEWEAAAFTRCRAVEALLDERPGTPVDFAAKQPRAIALQI
jgi:hypothetical protein